MRTQAFPLVLTPELKEKIAAFIDAAYRKTGVAPGKSAAMRALLLAGFAATSRPKKAGMK